MMAKFLLKKILAGFLVIWGIVTLLFLVFNLLGDPVYMIVGENADSLTVQSRRAAYHLDKPLAVQYLWYLNDLSPIGEIDSSDQDAGGIHLFKTRDQHWLAFKWPNMRRSFASNEQVATKLANKLPGTIILTFTAMLFATLVGITLGVYTGTIPGTWQDRLISFLAVIGTSAPSFFMAVLILRIFAVGLYEWTGLNVTGYIFEEKIFGEGYEFHLKNLILPALALGIRPLAIFTQLTRASMIEVMASDYIRTATAKGLSRRQVVLRHALRNALNPVVTSISGWLASLLAGAFFVEYIFDWEGIGKVMIDALNGNDYPVILGAAIFIGVGFVIINIITDIIYTRLDPRVKLA